VKAPLSLRGSTSVAGLAKRIKGWVVQISGCGTHTNSVFGVRRNASFNVEKLEIDPAPNYDSPGMRPSVLFILDRGMR
jgi:hypothetical protein